MIQQAESNIRNAQQTISFLEESLASLQSRDAQARAPPAAAAPLPPHSMPPPGVSAQPGAAPVVPVVVPVATAAPIDSSVAYRQPTAQAPAPAPAPALGREETVTRRHYTALDLLRSDTPLTRTKIQRKRDQLEHKLQLERQYKLGFDKIAKLYEAEGDRRSRDDAEAHRAQTASKLVLIQQALKYYQQLDVREEEAPTNAAAPARRTSKPQSGTLSIAIQSAKELDHAAVPSRERVARDSFVAIRVEDAERVQTHPARNDSWNESFQLRMENTHEVELIVFDRVGTAPPVPIGLVWLRLSDIADHQRKVRVGQVDADGVQASPASAGQEWVTADGVQRTATATSARAPGAAGAAPPADAAVEGWFTVEPHGSLHLRLSFAKENAPRHKFDAGLGRQGAVRKRREDVAVVNGHQFVQRQFYQMIRCALCGELLLNASGSQCRDCNYTCHRKCVQKVVTRCISKSAADSDRDENKLNHRIPHRWEPFTNLGANWCCHCGTMLSLGRRSNRKCSECDVTCHAACAHLVPDLCGMSMEMANQMLANIATIQKNRSAARSPAAATTPKRLSTANLAEPGRPAQPPPRSPVSPAPPGRVGADALATSVHGLALSPPSASTAPTSAGAAAGVVPPPPSVSPAPGAAPGQASASGMSTPTSAMPGAYGTPPPGASAAARRHADDARGPAELGATGTSAPAHPILANQLPPGGVVPSPQKAVSKATAPPATMASEMPASSDRAVTLDDFNFLAVLGKGNFGKVMLAEEKHTGQLYAIKVLKKEFIIENDEIDSTRSEKRVFLTAAREQHPFLLNLHSCFQTETRVYFVMEYVSGGDLMLHIQREQFNLHRARFYAAEVLLALEYFHKHGIIYRDLKLDNIMLTLDGHIKIADYGLCKEGMWHGHTTATFCGTPEFMAPEILLEQRYGRAVDWWAFGILLYEMLLGQAPFRGDDEDEIFDAILEDEPLYPIQMPRDSVSLLQRLLTRDPARRLGAGPNDAEDIKAHPFFRDINWDDLLHKRVTPPFRPTLKSASDTTWFDTEVRLRTTDPSSPAKSPR